MPLGVRVRIRDRGAPEGGLRELGVGEAEQLVVTVREEVEDGLVGVRDGGSRVLARSS